jgi:hypothetical protein
MRLARRPTPDLARLCHTAEGAAQPHNAIEQMHRMGRWIVVEHFDESQSENSGWVHAG